MFNIKTIGIQPATAHLFDNPPCGLNLWLLLAIPDESHHDFGALGVRA